MKKVNKSNKATNKEPNKEVNASNYALKCKYCDNTNFTASPSGAIHCKSMDCIAVYAYGNKDSVIDWHCINEDEMHDYIQYQSDMNYPYDEE